MYPQWLFWGIELGTEKKLRFLLMLDQLLHFFKVHLEQIRIMSELWTTIYIFYNNKNKKVQVTEAVNTERLGSEALLLLFWRFTLETLHKMCQLPPQ